MVPPVNSELLAAALPNARTVVVEGAGHVVFTDRPDAVTTAMIAFLDGLGLEGVTAS
jgi:pimeloyl-ACP methyl ester carboxylesterase